MIDTDKYDNEGIELSDGGTICFPKSDGRIERIDKDGNIIEVRYQSNGVLYAAHEGQEWYELFDSRKALLAEIKRLREENKKQIDVLTTLDEMIRYGKDHVEMMKALEQGLDLPETWKEMIE